jgi:iron-sulfur cluster assembly accessory protein
MIKRAFSTLQKTSSVIITDNAWDKMINISETQKMFRFIFSASSGGCNGYNYKLGLINDKEYDKLYNTQTKNIKLTIFKKDKNELIIDPVSEFLLLGTTIDYIPEDYSKSIFENKFVFMPNKTLASSCGCGISFTPK